MSLSMDAMNFIKIIFKLESIIHYHTLFIIIPYSSSYLIFHIVEDNKGREIYYAQKNSPSIRWAITLVNTLIMTLYLY
ncbi:hypothetical protein RCH20_000200 [Psychrobacter sp. PL15]|nr:hypothetical protein [Psychrobacter sp. PL15]